MATQIWDTAGQDRFRSIISSYYRGAHGVVLVYDCGDVASVDNLSSVWMEQVKRYARPDTPMLLVGNKEDLVTAPGGERLDVRRSAAEFAENNRMAMVTTSARTGTGVSNAFVGIARMLMAEARENGGRFPGKSGAGAGSGSSEGSMPPPRSSSVFDCCRVS